MDSSYISVELELNDSPECTAKSQRSRLTLGNGGQDIAFKPMAMESASEYLRSMSVENLHFPDKQVVKHFTSSEDLREFLDRIGTEKDDHNFKILKLTCASVEASLNLMLAEWFSPSFNRATHCFFILIQIQSVFEYINTEDLKLLQSVFSHSKPLVIQWSFTDYNEHCVFYKLSNETNLIPLNQIVQNELVEEKLVEKLTLKGSHSLPLLLKALSHGLGGFFAGDLSKIGFDVKKEFDGWRLLDYAARDDDDLSLRLLNLVEWDLTAISGEQRVLEIAAEYSSPRSVSALLDEPIIVTGLNPSLSFSQKELLQLVDVNNNTPLTISIAKGRADTMEYFILCGADINYRKKMQWNSLMPIQIAWDNKFYDKVLILLEADSPFPDGYHLDDLGDYEVIVKLRELVNIRKKFHQSIIDKDEDKVNDFIRDYPHLRYAYNYNNQTALMTALKSGAYKIYALLESKKFTASKSEDLAALKDGLSEQDNNDLKEAKYKYFRKVKDTHIMNLLSKWRMRGVEIETHSIIVRNLFERLDQIPEISTVLKVIEYAEALEIIFDFNNDCIIDLDSTQTESTSGSCDYKVGRLYVAAKQPLAALLGTLAHKLTHLAMQTVFDNDCNPYTTSDGDTKSLFGAIVDKYQNSEGMHSTIAKVFKAYIKYPKQWPSELIVCVPHLLASHHEQKNDHHVLENLRKGAPELFSFYSENVQRQFEEFIRDPSRFKAQIKLRRLNDLLGQLHVMEESKIRLKSPSLLNDNSIDFNTILILSCNLPQLTKSDLYQTLKYKEGDLRDKIIVTTADQFKNDKQAREIYDTFQSPIKPILIVDCSRDYNLHHFYLWETICSFRKKQRIILIADPETAFSITNKSNEFQINVIEKQYNWMDLEAESQNILLERSVNFQGYQISLNKLTKHNSCLMKSISFQDLLQSFQIKIGKSLPVSYGYDERFYIERTLEEWPNNISKFLSATPAVIYQKDLYHQKLIVIADTAGTGKSTLLTHFSRRIKEQDPSCWVLKYDLNNHTDLLEEQRKKRFKPMQFLRQKLLNLQTQFENTLFEECLAQNKVVLMFDGFDEISPRYNEVVLELVETFHQSPIKQLWITTRPHFKKDLEQKLGAISYILRPFSLENQVDFLTRFWTSLLPVDSQVLDYDRIRNYAFGLVERLSRSIRDNKKQLTGVPLQTRMLGEAFAEDFEEYYHSMQGKPNLPKGLDILEVYEKFLDRKYLIYVSEKNNAAKESVATKDLVSFLKGGVNLRKIHQQLALESLFPKQKQKLLFSKKKHILHPAKLNRVGIVEYIGDKPRFIHRTFSEYYVMDFLICQLRKTNQPYIREFLLKTILMARDHQVMRSFFDGMLKKITIKIEALRWFGQGVDTFWREGLLRNSKGTILHNAVIESNANIVTFLLESLKGMQRNTSTLRKIFSARDNERDRFTIWHLAACNGNGFLFPKMNQWAKEFGLTRKELKLFILLRGEDMGTILHLALYLGYVETSLDILNMASDILTQQEFKSLLLSKDTCGGTPCGLAAQLYKKGLFISILNLTSKVLDLTEFKDILFTFDVQNETAWHKVAKTGDLNAFDWFFSWSKNNVTTDDIKKFLLKSNNSVWPNLAHRCSVERLENFRKWSENMNLDFVQDVLLSRNIQLEQAWHQAARGGDVTVLQKLVEFCQEFKLNLYDHVILSKIDCGRTTWQIAAMHGNVHILEYLVNISRNIQLDLKSDLLLHNDKIGKNSWHLAATTGNVQSMRLLWDLGKELCLNVKEELLLSKDEKGHTAWFLSCDQGRSETVEMLWEVSQELLDSCELKALLQSKDENGEYLWHRIRKRNDLPQKYWKYCLTIFDSEELEEFLLGGNLLGKTVWHQLAYDGDVENMKVLWKLCAELKLKTLNKKKLLLRKDNQGATPFYCAAHVGNMKGLEKLWEFAKTAKFTLEELRSLILDKAINGNSVWHQLYMPCLQMLWDFALEIELDPKRDLLMCKGFRNRTLWHIAASVGGSSVLEKLYELGESIDLKAEEYRLMFLEKDFQGNTVWHITSRANSIGVLQILRKICKEKGIKVKEDLLSIKDNDGKTIWHSMVEKISIKTIDQSHLLFTSVILMPEGLKDVVPSEYTNRYIVSHVKTGIMEGFHQFTSEEDLTPAEFMNILLDENNAGNTVWHLTADRYPEYLKNIWSLAKASKLSPEDFKVLLHHQDKFGDTIWHKILKSKKLANLNDLFIWSIEILDSQGLYRLLTLTNADAKTIWHVSAEYGAVETMKIIMDSSKSKLDVQTLCQMMEIELQVQAPLSLAVTGRHVETIKFLLEIASEEFAKKWCDKILAQAVIADGQDFTPAILDEIQRHSSRWE